MERNPVDSTNPKMRPGRPAKAIVKVIKMNKEKRTKNKEKKKTTTTYK